MSTTQEGGVNDAVSTGEPNPRENEFQNAKVYLSSQFGDSGLNLYDHLSNCLKRILQERPPNAADIFETMSEEIKATKGASDCETMEERLDRATELALAKIQTKLFQRSGADEEEAAEEDAETPLPNLMQTAFFFEQGGVGLNREEMFRVWLSLKKLIETFPLEKVRFWGKILGTEQNYYIAEVDFREGEEMEEEQEEEEEADEEEKDDGPEDEEGDEEANILPPDMLETISQASPDEMEDKPPKIDWKPPPVAPKEDQRAGANKHIYFVCNEPGKAWIKLPSITPAQIVAARQMRKYFTGRLDAPVVTYPPFPGTEINYLRAQVARISAGTQVSPRGLYTFDEEEEEEEEGGERENYQENPDFEGIPVRELVDLSSWVHHTMHILPQGRTKWWNPVQKNEDDFEEDEEDEEEKEGGDEPVKEEGPPLLTLVSDDAHLDSLPPWTAVLSSQLVPQYAVAVLSSNLWPGAQAFAFGKTFENLYVGWGHKYSADNHTPIAIPAVMSEFAVGPTVIEADDPTPEEEAQLKAAQAQAEEGEEGAEEGAEEDDEEDD